MNRVEISLDNPSIARIEEKCINCGMCLKTCQSLNCLENDCINCGQCIMTCPSGAIVPKFEYQKVLNYLKDTDYTVVAFTSPAVRVAIGDEFGYEPGSFLEGKMVSALKELGFSYVFDTTFGADVTIMEEASELLERINNKTTPLFTSCCPSWVEYMKKYHLDDLNLVSSCKSPIAMEAILIKSYFADMYELDKNKIIAVAVTPCVSKKQERKIYPETDFVITTRELVMMIKSANIAFRDLKDQEFDHLLGKGSGGGLIFASSGGVMESALRTAYYMLNKEKAPDDFYQLTVLRGEQNLKTAEINMNKFSLKVAVVNSIKTVSENYDMLKTYDFVEVMTCPGGCIGGSGQTLVPIKDIKDIRAKRIGSIYNEDKKELVRDSYRNEEVKDAYSTYINKNDVELHNHQKALQETTN